MHAGPAPTNPKIDTINHLVERWHALLLAVNRHAAEVDRLAALPTTQATYDAAVATREQYRRARDEAKAIQAELETITQFSPDARASDITRP